MHRRTLLRPGYRAAMALPLPHGARVQLIRCWYSTYRSDFTTDRS